MPPTPNSGGGGDSDAVGEALAAWIRRKWPEALGGAWALSMAYFTGMLVFFHADIKKDVNGLDTKLESLRELYIKDLQARCGVPASTGGTTSGP